jgi:hypothetical protein
MPDWRELNRTISENLDLPLNEDDLMSAATDCVDTYGQRELYESLRELLHVGIAKPGAAHKALAELRFETIFTTNFDTLLEDAYRELGIQYRLIHSDETLSRHGGPHITNIVKMHGDLEAENIVLTRYSYDAFEKKRKGIARYLSCMMMTRTPLFIGYSMNDPNFKSILEYVDNIMGHFRRTVYLVRFERERAESNDNVGHDEFRFLRSIPLKVGSNGHSAALCGFLSEIRNSIDISGGEAIRNAKPEAFAREVDLKNAATLIDSSAMLSATSNLCLIVRERTKSYFFIYKKIIEPTLREYGLKSMTNLEVPTSRNVHASERTRLGLLQSRIGLLYTDNLASEISSGFISTAENISRPYVILQFRKNSLSANQFDENIVVLKDEDDFLNAMVEFGLVMEKQIGAPSKGVIKDLIEHDETRDAIIRLCTNLDVGLRRLIRQQMKNVKKPTRSIIDIGSLDTKAMTRFLFESGDLTKNEYQDLKRLSKLKGNAIHRNIPPSQEDAMEALEILTLFRANHKDEIEKPLQFWGKNDDVL